MTMHRVLLGGSFACDDALARPVETLLQQLQISSGVGTVVEWLAYGTGTDIASLDEPLRRAHVDLVVLMVRLSDLQAAHPELRTTTASMDSIKIDFITQLRRYDQRTDASTTPPLVVLFCPPPPTVFSQAQETWLCHEIESLRHVSCRPSSDVMEFLAGGTEAVVVSEWYDETRDKREHAPFTQRMLHVLALGCVRQIARLGIQSPKKVIVLDCDNTLWGGAVADLGASRVDLSERFLGLQRFAVKQQRRGMLLCLCSKNIVEDVDAVFRERASEMVLSKDDHIVLSKINWQTKSDNIREMAQQLQLGLDAFVFVDDNPVECNEVEGSLPMVTVIRVPDDFGCNYLSTQWVFDTPLGFQSTNEDGERTKMYQQNAQREELARRAPSQAAFLSSLGVRIKCERLVDSTSPAFARVLQLHQRTNTFNVATTFSRALTSDILSNYIAPVTNGSHYALTSTVTDRYGHYGLVCTTLFRVDDSSQKVTKVDSFLMSCRSLNRGVEHAMVKKIAEIAGRCGAEMVEVAWEPTVRNEPVRVFFASLPISVFVTPANELVSTRAEKITRSASSAGCWRLKTTDAVKISFLQSEEQAFQPQQSVLPLSWSLRTQALMSRIIRKLIRLLTAWIPRTWFTRLLAWINKHFHKRISMSNRSQHGIGLSFSSSTELGAFIESRTSDLRNEVHRIAVHNESDSTDVKQQEEETDEAYRLRVRHETKLYLLNHVSKDAPRVVWAPHRSNDIHLDKENSKPVNSNVTSMDTLQQFHRPCATPSCSSRVYWESECAFQRCRTCCYRVQRLLARATSDRVHAKARAHACTSLVEDYAVAMEDVQAKEEWCKTHTNDRRRK